MLVAIETDDRRAGHGESSTRSLGCQEQLACPVLFDQLGIRVVALLVIGGAAMFGGDGQAPRGLGRDAGDESERDDGGKGHRSKCGNSSLHTRAGLSRGTQCSGSGGVQ